MNTTIHTFATNGEYTVQPYSATILALYLAVGFVCSTTVLLEPLYAQPSSFVGPDEQPSPEDIPPEEPGFVPEPEDIPPEEPGFVPEPEDIPPEEPGFVPEPEDIPPEEPGFVPEPEDIPPEEPGFVPEPEDIPPEEPGFVPEPEDIPPEEPGFVPEPEDIPPGENPNFGPPVVPEVEEIIEDSVGSVEDTFSTINENSPVSPLLIGGIVAVVAIGAGVASFSRHHHGRSSSSHSTQDQTQQEDTEEEQIYEDVQIVTQGGIEEV